VCIYFVHSSWRGRAIGCIMVLHGACVKDYSLSVFYYYMSNICVLGSFMSSYISIDSRLISLIPTHSDYCFVTMRVYT